MKLSQTVSYGLRAALLIADSPSDKPLPCSKLAEDGQMPQRFLLQVLRSLVRGGVLDSTRGIAGGYLLKHRPQEITLLQIIEAIDGPLRPEVSGPARTSQPLVDDSLLHALQSVTASARRHLGSITLADLRGDARANGQHRPHFPKS